MAKEPRSLFGRVAVVTGGGRGIGKSLALALASEGCRVAIGDVDAAAAEAAAAELGPDAVGLPLDVTDRPGFTAFLDEVERRLGPIDVLVNNAGIMPVGPFDEEDDATAIRILEIDLHGVIHGTKEAVRRMKPRGTGHIVNVASSAGKTGFPNLATYCAAKHGVVGLSEAVRSELRGTGVEISVVMPGIVKTELSTGLVESPVFKAVSPRTSPTRSSTRSSSRATTSSSPSRSDPPGWASTCCPEARASAWAARSSSTASSCDVDRSHARRLRGARRGQRPGH